MADLNELVYLVARQAADGVNSTTNGTAVLPDAHPSCDDGNGYNGKMGLRVSSIFVILVGSVFGAVFPVFANRHQGVGVPDWAFFIAKYFGSGVIIATAFIHLLAPANDALKNPCLTGPINSYDWVEGIALMTIFVLFFVELMAMRWATFADLEDHPDQLERDKALQLLDKDLTVEVHSHLQSQQSHHHHHTPGDDHLGHSREHTDVEAPQPADEPPLVPEGYAAQMTAIFILEFGVVFHSIFVGLTLAVSGKEFDTLYVVLVFHQTFEGLGLGSRLAVAPWPRSKRWTPYILALAYGFSTPIAIAIGLGVRRSYPPGSQTTLIVNGVFDSISAGILIYTGLVELLAHEFMFSEFMRRAKASVVLTAFGLVCLGAGLMALLGKWA
ncbi:MAG: hypothetical protein M1819_004717 [Sarea resinae]|nr:MAG: hypothetical protein M1819_004717 [Sarea resinae]